MDSDFIGEQYDTRYFKHVGWSKEATYADPYKLLFSAKNFDLIAAEVKERLASTGYSINVSRDVIGSALSNITIHNSPKTGDIYTRYVVPDSEPRNDVANLTQQAIDLIVNTILDDLETTKLNQRLSIWSTVYGDGNPEGLRGHSIIRYKENDYMKGVFNMNY